ncbi:MAG: hypothetical protein C0507_22455 [Cyanobacteria bacterium PR.3.49]|nr:hypothetical protein [Cyanobacteria bacterium PR.3.49]
MKIAYLPSAVLIMVFIASSASMAQDDGSDEPTDSTTTTTTTTTTTSTTTSTYTIPSTPRPPTRTTINPSATAGGAPRASARYSNETPGDFLQRYFTAKRRAGSRQDLNAFHLSNETASLDKLSEAQKKQYLESEKNSFDEEKLCTPQKAVVVFSKNRGSYLQVHTRSRENISSKTMDFAGKYILYKGASGWLIYSEFSKLDEGDGNELSFGTDPDAKPETLSSDDRYQLAINDAFKSIWKPSPKTSGNVTASLRNSSNGTFRILSIRDERGSQAAVAEVTSMLAKVKLPPLPANTGTPIINLQLRWSPNTTPSREIKFTK